MLAITGGLLILVIKCRDEKKEPHFLNCCDAVFCAHVCAHFNYKEIKGALRVRQRAERALPGVACVCVCVCVNAMQYALT